MMNRIGPAQKEISQQSLSAEPWVRDRLNPFLARQLFNFGPVLKVIRQQGRGCRISAG
jgi:hypothetical protein